MKVVILCGGKGTRLKEETQFRPKPLVQVGERPILWHIMKLYAHYDFTDFILCLGYMGEMIKQYFINYEYMNSDLTVSLNDRQKIFLHNHQSDLNWRVTMVNTGIQAQTGSRIKKIQKYIDQDELFMVTYGDGVADLNIAELLKFHRSHGRIGTVTGVRPLSRFGELEVEGNGVKLFSEKSQVNQGWINGGFFVFNYEFFNYLTDVDQCVLERGPLEALAAKGELQVYRHRGYWQCMDTYRDMEQMNHIWQSGQAPWKVWENR